MVRVYDCVILGAGISGMVSASILSNQSEQKAKILVLDEYPELGGNHISVDIGDYTCDIGSFFFADRSPLVHHFPEFLRLYENQAKGTYSIARITPLGKTGRYPFDFRLDVFDRGLIGVLRILLSIVKSRLTVDPSRSAAHYAEYWMGGRFFVDSGLRRYMTRFYSVDPALIEGVFAKKRMSWIETNMNIRSLWRRLRNLDKPKPGAAQKQLVRPRAGFPSLYEAAREKLAANGVMFKLGIGLSQIEGNLKSGFSIKLVSGEIVRTERLVSTIPLNQVLRLCGKQASEKIKAASLLTLFISFGGKRGFDQNVLYNFYIEGKWKRLTMHSDFYGLVDGREYFSLECVVQDMHVSVEDYFTDFCKTVQKCGLFAGDLCLEGHRLTESAYPVYIAGATEAATAGLNELADLGIESFGRQGGFDYQPISVVSTRKAEEVLGYSPGMSA